MYRVFTDFHHSGLLNSLILLFEKRLGGQVYRPIGRHWHTLGYWHVYDHPATVAQFLDIGGATPDGTEPLNEIEARAPAPGVFFCKDIASRETNKAITYERFMKSHFDFVVASIPQHIIPFRELCNSHPKKPKLIYQVGNAWNISIEQEAAVDVILSSARLSRIPGKPFIEYHQEFDLDIFHPVFTYPKEKITSFVNCFSSDRLFDYDWQIFQEVEKSLPDWDFKVFGGGCRDGSVGGDIGVAEEMRHSRFIWHTKNGGDGYGHIIHNAAAIGRPAIVRKSHYQGKMAEDLMLDGETCIAIDGLSIGEIVKKINHYSEPENYQKMCKATYQNFLSRVNFDAEAAVIANLLQEINESV